MRTYEGFIVVKPQFDEQQLEEFLNNKYFKMIKDANGEIVKVDNWGLKNFAYPIKKNTQGYYVRFIYKVPEDFVKNLENRYNMDENILRYINLKVEEHSEEAEAPSSEENRRRLTKKERNCPVCREGLIIDYKSFEILKKFTTESGKIIPRRFTRVCAKHQRRIAKEIKRARHLAFLPFVVDITG